MSESLRAGLFRRANYLVGRYGRIGGVAVPYIRYDAEGVTITSGDHPYGGSYLRIWYERFVFAKKREGMPSVLRGDEGKVQAAVAAMRRHMVLDDLARI
jgi:hypothetical protein